MFSITASAKQSAKRAATALAVMSGVVAGSLLAAPLASASVPVIGPGDSIAVRDAQGQFHSCTVGPYMVKTATSVPQFFALTAGHCGTDGSPVYTLSPSNDIGEYVGTISGSFEGKEDRSERSGYGYDYAMIKLSKSNMTRSGSVNGYRITKSLSLNNVADIADGKDVKVCSMGHTSGYRCGTLESVDMNSSEIIVNLPGSKGDSGGPVWVASGGTAQLIGTLSGSKGQSMSGYSTRIRVSPLDKPVEDYGALVLNSYTR